MAIVLVMNMTPIEMSDLAAELREHMETLAELDARPIANAIKIEERRQLAVECVEQIQAYLIASANFGGL